MMVVARTFWQAAGGERRRCLSYVRSPSQGYCVGRCPRPEFRSARGKKFFQTGMIGVRAATIGRQQGCDAARDLVIVGLEYGMRSQVGKRRQWQRLVIAHDDVDALRTAQASLQPT